MCRNITELRGLEPAASDEEIERVAREVADEIGDADTAIETWVRAALRKLSR